MYTNIITRRLATLSVALVALLAIGCSKQDTVCDLDFSRYKKSLATPTTDTDKWIEENLRNPYNIQVLWRYADIETNMGYNVIPPSEENVQPFLATLNDVFIKSYIDIYKGNPTYRDSRDFIRTYVPKQILLLGEWEYTGNGTIRLGVAEGGRRIVLSGINYWRDASQMERFLHTIFHEFSHIMHQTKLYDIEFEKITKEGYTAQWSNPTDNYSLRMAQAREQGFVSDYARKNRDEDFVETIAYYLMLTPEGWEDFLRSIDGSVKYDDTMESVQKAGLSPDERQEALRDLDKKVITQGEIWDRHLDNIWDLLQKHIDSGEITAEIREQIMTALDQNKVTEDQWNLIIRLTGKSLDDHYNDILARSPKLVVTYDEVWSAHSNVILKILNKAVIRGEIAPSILGDIGQALKNKKLTPEQKTLIEEKAGKSLDDLYVEQSVPAAKETKVLGSALNEKAEHQAKAAKIEAAAKARDKIRQKQTFIAAYLKEKWGIDMDKLRDIVLANLAAVRNPSPTAEPIVSGMDARIIEQGLDTEFRCCTNDSDSPKLPQNGKGQNAEIATEK